MSLPATNPFARIFRVQVFVWTDKNGVARRWSVEHALRLINQLGLKPHRGLITLELAKDAVRKNNLAPELLPANIAKADTSIPIIIIEAAIEGDTGLHLIIDGWHRIAKLIQHEGEALDAYVLNQHQSKLIQIQ